MADEEPPRQHVPPAFLCRLCRQGIQKPEELLIIGMAVLHEACLERSTASDLAHIQGTMRRDSTLDYKGHRLEPQSYLNPESRCWVPKVLILRLSGLNHPRKMLTAHDDARYTFAEADDHALQMGRRWVDEVAQAA